MFISYAQNFEDVLLWRALKHVKAGFYIDIGAQSPVEDSVSLAFYEHGWRGVNVEPIPSYAAALREARPEDEIVEAAISTEEGTITFFDVPSTGLATGVKQIADRHLADGFDVSSLEVKTLRLCTLLDRYENKNIHWLKIDVEGMERDVVESWLPSTVRPWVVVIESTVPRSSEVNHSEWEPQLLALGYKFASFDGLNRFYVHESHEPLVEALSLGANIFDDFAVGRSSYYARNLKVEIDRLNRRIEEEAAAIVHLAQATGATQSNGQAANITFEQAIEALANEIGRLHHHIANSDAAHAAQVAALQEAAERREATIAAHEAEIGRLHHHIANSDAAHGAQAAALQEAAERREATVAAHEAEISRLHHHIANSETAHAEQVEALQKAAAETERLHHEMMETAAARAQTIAALESDIANRDAQLAERDGASAALTLEVAQLRQAAETALHRVIELERSVSAVHASTSWRVTAPMRGLKRGVGLVLLAPHQIARASLDRTIRWASARPRTKAMLKRLVRLVPPIERRLIAYAEARGGDAVAHPQWMIEPDPVVLREWEELLKVPRRDRSR